MGQGTAADFERNYAHISATEDELRWRDIPWIPDLWEGRARAAETGRPLFIWAMNGDPLGAV
jgi:hypothetical protein